MVVDVLRGGPRAFLQAGVGEHVHDHMVVGANEALDGRKSGGPAGRVKHDLAPIEELGNHALELQANVWCCRASAAEPGAMHAIFLDRARWPRA